VTTTGGINTDVNEG